MDRMTAMIELNTAFAAESKATQELRTHLDETQAERFEQVLLEFMRTRARTDTALKAYVAVAAKDDRRSAAAGNSENEPEK